MHSDFFKEQTDGNYFIGLTILGKLGCPNQKKKVLTRALSQMYLCVLSGWGHLAGVVVGIFKSIFLGIFVIVFCGQLCYRE
jgi:hypothetical protein